MPAPSEFAIRMRLDPKAAKEELEAVLVRAKGDHTRAAEILEVKTSSLYRYMSQLGISPPQRPERAHERPDWNTADALTFAARAGKPAAKTRR